MSYVARVVRSLYNELGYYPKIRVLILYTADITRKQTKPYLNLGDFTMHIEEAFLSEVNSEKLWKRVSDKIKEKVKLDGKDLMQMIIYPLTFRKREDKEDAYDDKG